MKIAITGGIGSGKSYFCDLLRKRGFEVYDCDGAAKRIMLENSDVIRRLKEVVGDDEPLLRLRARSENDHRSSRRSEWGKEGGGEEGAEMLHYRHGWRI